MSDKPERGECRLYLPGHRVHPIQARKAAAEQGSTVHSVTVEGEVIALHTSNGVWLCRSHAQTRLLRLAEQRLPDFRLIARWSVLRIGLGSVRNLISLSNEDVGPWTPCR